MRTAVLTLAAGRHEHLRNQGRALARLADPPEAYYVVAMGDEGVRDAASPSARVIEVPAPGRGLPLAEARNRGAARAIADGAELLVLLDVDCVPGPRLLAHYRDAARRRGGALLCGPVTYLPPPPAGGYDLDRLVEDPHPARPAPPPGALVRGEDYTLFWSLSFAVSAATWTRLGGFCADFHGYGAEDTDFGQRARAAGVEMWWVGGASAFHQHHPPSAAPARAAELVANANLFHDRWGWWPMADWLADLAAAGAARFDPARGRWTVPG